MRRSNWSWALVGILFGVLGVVLVIGFIGRSDEDDPCSTITKPLDAPILVPSHDPGDTLTRTWHGIRLVLSYDSTTNTFNGTVENIGHHTVGGVTVTISPPHAVRADLGSIRGFGNLAPGQVKAITIDGGSKPFDLWGALQDYC